MTSPLEPASRPASGTAWGVMTLRAVHQLTDDLPHILDDPIAPRLLDADTRETLLDPARLAAMREARGPERVASSRVMRAHVVVRSRFAEDQLHDAVVRGVRQFVSLGAGYDTFAYRQPEWARSLQIIEVDQPATQQSKRDALAAAGIDVPGNVRYLAIDFERDTLHDGMLRGGFDITVPTFISCLGVLVYLTVEAADDVFAFAASLPPSSEIVSTFRARRDPHEPASAMAAAVAAAGEPWLSEFDSDELEARLLAMGFATVTVIGGSELDVRYALRRTDGLHPPQRMRMVSAVR